MRPRPAPLVLSCALLLLTGCGGSNLLDGSTASELQETLNTVRTAIDDGRCEEARSAARVGAERVDALPTSVDAELRRRLKEGFDELATRVRTDCKPTPTTTTEPTPTTTEAAPPTTEAPVEPQTTTETAPQTTTEETTTEETPPDGGLEPAPEEDQVVPDDSGGVTPGVDGPGATERSVRKRLEKQRKQAEKPRRKGNG